MHHVQIIARCYSERAIAILAVPLASFNLHKPKIKFINHDKDTKISICLSTFKREVCWCPALLQPCNSWAADKPCSPLHLWLTANNNFSHQKFFEPSLMTILHWSLLRAFLGLDCYSSFALPYKQQQEIRMGWWHWNHWSGLIYNDSGVFGWKKNFPSFLLNQI